MHIRMPRSILLASQGGIAPKQLISKQVVTRTISIETRESQNQDHNHPHHSQDQLEREPHDDRGEDQHHHHLHGHTDSSAASEEENKAVTSACLDRMPGPIVQASPGGTSPRTINNLHVSNHQHIERLGTIREERVQKESQDDHHQ
jgi:hypothetical protein